jgi:glycosyltransferase involved in cell wall biosynthesis
MNSDTKVTRDFLSVIVPAYKVESSIVKSLTRIKEVLDQVGYSYEIICVVDGRVDKTFRKAKALSKKFPERVRVVGYKNNLGKGHAVRFGMARSKGNIVAFIDAGLDLNPNGLSLLLEHFKWYRADIIVGSKRHPASKVYYPWQRRILSWGYQMAVRVLFGLNVKDTQVGMKFFRREVLKKVLPRVLVKAFAFDIEILSVANYLGFKRIYEAPIELEWKWGSSVADKGYLKTAFWTLWDTLAVFYRLNVRHYYDHKNRKNWITPKYLVLDDKK